MLEETKSPYKEEWLKEEDRLRHKEMVKKRNIKILEWINANNYKKAPRFK
jgi:hypothetical protein